MSALIQRVVRALALSGFLFATACGPGFGEDHLATSSEGLAPWSSLSAIDFSVVPTLPQAKIKGIFKLARDTHWLRDPGTPSILRRVSWLFPDGGCESRTEIVSHIVAQAYGEAKRPYKLFVSGSLRLETPYGIDGSVDWGWHVAPIVRDEETQQLWLLDPGVDLYTPVLLERWVARINPDASSIGFSLDSGLWYTPLLKRSRESNLDRAWDEQESAPVECDDEYLAPLLDCEETRLWDLGLNPHQLLQDSPPWLAVRFHYVPSEDVFLNACDACSLDRCQDDCR
jgi:hypothetical protein